MSAEYLARDVLADRLAVWKQRLGTADRRQLVVVAEDGGSLLGFGCAYAGEHPVWGSLVDNIHVTRSCHRAGIGRRIMRELAERCMEVAPAVPIYLWVLEANVDARRFYGILGARDVGQDVWAAPGGGVAVRRRLEWSDPRHLLAAER